jgi:CBS domain-containing protein
VIEIFTSEQARWKSGPLYDAVVQLVAREKSAARCLVTRAVAGSYENGEVASHRVLDLSHNMPLKIEIILPGPELDRLLPKVQELVGDGIVLVQDRDLCVHRTEGGLLPRGMVVRDVMTSAPVSVGLEADLRSITSLLVRAEFDGVPVVDGRGRFVGMVTQQDVADKAGMQAKPALLAALDRGRELSEADYREMFPDPFLTAQRLMTADVATTTADTALAEAARIMARNDLKRLPVVDSDRHLTGMLARIDVLRVASSSCARRRVLRGYGVSVSGQTAVGEVELLQVPTVSPETPAPRLFDLLDEDGQRIVVVDERGAPLGVISDKDLLPFLDPRSTQQLEKKTARDLMRTVPVLPEHTSVETAIEWMVEHRRKRVPVVDPAGVYKGMLSRELMLRVLAG